MRPHERERMSLFHSDLCLCWTVTPVHKGMDMIDSRAPLLGGAGSLGAVMVILTYHALRTGGQQ